MFGFFCSFWCPCRKVVGVDRGCGFPYVMVVNEWL